MMSMPSSKRSRSNSQTKFIAFLMNLFRKLSGSIESSHGEFHIVLIDTHTFFSFQKKAPQAG